MTTNSEKFIGTWHLLTWYNQDLDGNRYYPFGEDAVGYIMYAADGYMGVHIMKHDRPYFATNDLLKSEATEQAAAFQSYIAYSGRYEVLETKVIHHVEATLFPNWSGVKQERFFEFSGDQLILSTDPIMMNGQQQSAHLTWERCAAQE
ncbi:MAG: lipocalin-like domain-containing protein [Spirulina sp. SIO3F2]|nr:lipocalin-like domain-containing protein [Spirulina sp. SIO3F2]